MDKQQMIGLFLIGLVIIAYGYFNQPSAEDIALQTQMQDSIGAVQEKRAKAEEIARDNISLEQAQNQTQPSTIISNEVDSLTRARELAAAQSAFGVFHPSSTGDDSKSFVVENEKMIATIASRGGKILSLELKEFKTHGQEPLILFDERSDISIRFRKRGADYMNTRDLYFEAVDAPISLSGEEMGSFAMRLKTVDPNKYIDFIYSFKGDSYEVDFTVDMVGMQEEVDLNYGLMMEWDMAGISTEKSRKFEKTICSVFYRYMGDDRDYLSETSDDEEELIGTTNWVAFKQTFFSAIAMSDKGFPNDEGFISVREVPEIEGQEEETELVKQYSARLTLPMREGGSRAGFTFYFGPNDYQLFKAYDNELAKVVNTGWGIFGWMNEWLVIPIFKFLENRIASYGIIILILTIIIKMLLFPLTYKNYLSSAKMKVLKPEIEELNKKFEKEKDPVKKQQAQMALYKRTGVNPMAGCIPMVIQMPILYAMFRFFPSSIELRQKAFLWAEDLSSYDAIVSWTGDIPLVSWALGNHLSLFTVLMAISTLLYTHMNSSQMPAAQPGMPNMKTIMYIFPVMMLFFFNSFASGLSYYYLMANLISIGQMLLIKNVIIDEKKLRAEIEANKKKPVKKSAFQKRLEDAAKQRQKK